ncbi:MAG: MBL fold metallo-hydrolase [Gammaproteobacteria bacterium]
MTKPPTAKLTFIGATRQVTGSCYLLETESSRILLECGMFQGGNQAEKQNSAVFPFDTRKIDAVVISHTHLDHCGLLPKLVKDGYQGPVYMTQATSKLIKVMLTDSAFIELKDTEWENKQRLRAGKPLIEPLFTQDDVDEVLKLREPTAYETTVRITPDIELTYHEAGHILGSAVVALNIQGREGTKRLVFSGDLGNSDAALLKDPAVVTQADVLLLESTYGDRNHVSTDATIDEFREALAAAAESGGNVMIPAFAVGRTQEILYWLGKFYREGSLKQTQVFLDSPMAIAASDIYFEHVHLFNKEDESAFREVVKSNWQEWLPILKCTLTPEESMQINTINGGAIIIAGSGMCTGGRIRHHLKNNLWRRNAHLIIVGFQAQGTLGRALVDGARSVMVFRNETAVNATLHTLGGFSAHADQTQLLKWAGHFDKPRPELYLIHGELDKMLELQRAFHDKYHWYANIPKPGQTITF